MSFLADTVKRAIETAAGSPDDFCVTLESKRDKNQWIQLTAMSVNVAYPFAEHPLTHLPNIGIAIPDNFELGEWEPNSFVTFDHFAEDVNETGTFAQQYCEVVFGAADDATQFRCEDLWL